MNTALTDLSNGFADAVEQAGRNVVSVNEGGRAGVSGTVWRDGLVVSAENAIRDQQELTIELPSGASSSASIVGRDATTDIALLRLKKALKTSARFVNAGHLRIGQFILAVGAARSAGTCGQSRHHQRTRWTLANMARRPNRPVFSS